MIPPRDEDIEGKKGNLLSYVPRYMIYGPIVLKLERFRV